MCSDQEKFPNRLQLWQGAILHTIAHAIWVASYPMLSYELSWDGPNYNRQNSMGARGTITFAADCLVGVFFDEHSPRSPYQQGSNYDLQAYFEGMPADLLAIAGSQTLQYVLDDLDGRTMSIITAAFWSEGEYLAAAEPWSSVLLNGAHLVRIETLSIEDAIAQWQNEYDFSPSQVALLRTLYNHKPILPGTSTVLNRWEYAVLTEKGDAGIIESRELLANLGITIP